MTSLIEPAAFRTPAELDHRRSALVEIERLRALDAATVRSLRYDLFRGDALTREEADALFDVERTARPDCREWQDFFVCAIVDYLLWQQRPSGVLNEEQAEWLIGQADRARTFNAFAALVATIEEAHRIPAWFAPAVRGRAGRGWAAAELARAGVLAAELAPAA